MSAREKLAMWFAIWWIIGFTLFSIVYNIQLRWF